MEKCILFNNYLRSMQFMMTAQRTFVLILLFVCFSSVLFAQFPTKMERVCYVKSYWGATKNYVTAPVSWKTKQWLIAGGCVAIGTGLYFTDEWINDSRPPVSSEGLQVLKYGLDYWGNGLYSMPLAAGMFLYGVIGKHHKPVKVSMKVVQSFVLSAVVTRVLKYTFNRSRPYNDVGAQSWQPFSSPFNLSFPSGHTTAAFAVASVVAISYKDRKIIPILAYGMASAVAVSRVLSGEHWASDVFVGAVIGCGMGSIVSRFSCFQEVTGWRVEGSTIKYVF